MVTRNVLRYNIPLGVQKNANVLIVTKRLFLDTYIYIQFEGISILLKNYFIEWVVPPTFCGSFYPMVSKKYTTDQYVYLAFSIMEVHGLGEELKH